MDESIRSAGRKDKSSRRDRHIVMDVVEEMLDDCAMVLAYQTYVELCMKQDCVRLSKVIMEDALREITSEVCCEQIEEILELEELDAISESQQELPAHIVN